MWTLKKVRDNIIGCISLAAPSLVVAWFIYDARIPDDSVVIENELVSFYHVPDEFSLFTTLNGVYLYSTLPARPASSVRLEDDGLYYTYVTSFQEQIGLLVHKSGLEKLAFIWPHEFDSVPKESELVDLVYDIDSPEIVSCVKEVLEAKDTGDMSTIETITGRIATWVGASMEVTKKGEQLHNYIGGPDEIITVGEFAIIPSLTLVKAPMTVSMNPETREYRDWVDSPWGIEYEQNKDFEPIPEGHPLEKLLDILEAKIEEASVKD